MIENEGAGAGQEDGQGGSGAPSGGSPEGGSENETADAKFERRIKAALANQKASLRAEFDAQLQAFRAGADSQQPKREEAPKRYTRKELNAAVEAGQISRDQADEVWDTQVRTEATEVAARTAREVVVGNATKERIDADLASYKRLKPEIMERGSETREQVQEEYNYLTARGAPKTEATELAAIRAILGPLEKLEKASTARRASESEQQGGGSGAPKGGSGGGQKQLHEHLSAENKAFYESGIKSGRYKDWAAVNAELKYASPNVRKRLGLPAA